MAPLRSVASGLVMAGLAAAGDCSGAACAAAAASSQETLLLQTTRRSGRSGRDLQAVDHEGVSSAHSGGNVNVCYFTNWARYRSGLINKGKDVFEMDLDGSLCTHFMYGFASVKPAADGSYYLQSNDPNADHPSGHEGQDGLCPDACNDPSFKTDWSQTDGERCDWPCAPTRTLRGYEGLTVGMKKKNPTIKALISVGGWSFNDCAASVEATYGQGSATCEIFSTIAKSEAKIRAFAANVIEFCRKWGFDGFDLDWEYPVVAGHNDATTMAATPQDYDNYVTMLRVMKEEFLAENPSNPLLLTAAVGVGKSTVEDAYNIAEMDKHLDLINLMTYDMHGGWESRTGCNANLYATEEDVAFGGGVGAGEAVAGYPLSVSWAVDYWLEHGASPSKLTMGLGTYGRGWKLVDPAQHGYNAPASGPSAPAATTKEAGYMAYYEIMELLRAGEATRYYDEERQCPYIVTASGEWFGYDDEQSMRAKLDFVKERGLAGTMVWALDLDDFEGAYSDGRKYPLISLALSHGGSASTTAATTAAPTSAAPTTAPVTTAAPETTTQPATTVAPATTAAPEATTQPATTAAPVTTAAPETSIQPATTTAAPETTMATGTTQPAGGCSAIPGNSAAATDGDCAPCASGYKWWPCNAEGLCQGSCSETSGATTATTTETPAATTAPATTAPTAPATTEAPATTSPAAGGACVRNEDCSENAWCNDASYDTWCPDQVRYGGACPSPRCRSAA